MTSTTTGQQAFELEIEPARPRILPPLFYPDLLTATHCRDCHRPVAGRWTRLLQGGGEHGFYVVCDRCNPLGALPRHEGVAA